MAGIKAYNRGVIKKGFDEYKEYIYNTAEKELREWSWNMLNDAIKWRFTNPKAHNFTGNLINSIVVCLYRDRKPVIAYFASSLVPEAIQPKMRLRKRRMYYFNPDYDGVRSSYFPTVKTNGGWGKDDAEQFFFSYRPPAGNMFDIVVAYPVEYANFIEQERQTTGIIQTWQAAKIMGLTFLKVA